ncbi:MAG TPA: M20/M25/M40 family metallo-hydrolase, partial [Allosphingosinicella sp.]
MNVRFLGVVAALLAGTAAPAFAQDAGEAEFRSIYKELVETNTTLSAGSCTLAAERMAARLKTAGFADENLHLIVAPDHPKEGSLVAILPGTDAKAKALLLLAHIDVVEAKAADWERDPFTLIEEDGYFSARGSSDDKAQASVWVDTLARFKREGFKPKRT